MPSLDEFVKSHSPVFVIPANAGIQGRNPVFDPCRGQFNVVPGDAYWQPALQWATLGIMNLFMGIHLLSSEGSRKRLK